MTLFNQIAEQHYAAPPNGWRTRKIKFLADIQTSNVDKLSNDDEEPVRLCNYTDVYYNDRITPDMPFMEATATPKEIGKFALKAGQVFITKDSEGWDDIGIPALVTEDMPGVLCGYHLAIFTPDQDKLDGAFLAWLCRADALNDQFKLSANGVTRFGLGQYPMKNAVVGYPPLETQRRIVAFLDEKTAQIDALIARKRALLDRLAEKRQAIITQAVTKGLNPAAPMRDSGIDWLGQIPAHWEVRRLKEVGTLIGGAGFPHEYQGFTDLELPFFKVMDLGLVAQNQPLMETSNSIGRATARTLGASIIVADDIVFAKVGAALLLNRFRKIGRDCCIDNNMMAFRSSHLIEPEFALQALSRIKFADIVNPGAVPSINGKQIGELCIALPPKPEQASVAAFIIEQASALEYAEARVAESLDRLSEYRSALITNTVTGQIKGLQ